MSVRESCGAIAFMARIEACALCEVGVLALGAARKPIGGALVSVAASVAINKQGVQNGLLYDLSTRVASKKWRALAHA